MEVKAVAVEKVVEVKAVAVEKVVGTGLLQRVILLEADAETPPQKVNNDICLRPFFCHRRE